MYEPSEQNSDTSSSDIIPVDLLDGSGWQLQLPSGESFSTDFLNGALPLCPTL